VPPSFGGKNIYLFVSFAITSRPLLVLFDEREDVAAFINMNVWFAVELLLDVFWAHAEEIVDTTLFVVIWSTLVLEVCHGPPNVVGLSEFLDFGLFHIRTLNSRKRRIIFLVVNSNLL
jgi:hypothetical protein